MQQKQSLSYNQGFSLIEVLITLVLITLGVLGMLALQSKSIQYTQDAVHRNSAIHLANDLLQMMRAQRGEFFRQQPPQTPLYLGLKSSSSLYNGDGTFKLSAQLCPDSRLPQTLVEQGHCWLKTVQAQLPDSHTEDIQSQLKVCPSFRQGQCAGAGYQGGSVEVQLAWRGAPGACVDGPQEDVCIYRTRGEL